MRNIFLFSILLSFLFMPLLAEDFKRHELLNEGRRFTDTITKYSKIREKTYPASAIIDVTFFPGYLVDTNQGADRTQTTLASATIKYISYDWLSVYFILHHYEFRSLSRNSINTIYSGGTLYPELDEDGNNKYQPIRYGTIEEILLGFDISPINFLTFNLSAIYSWEDLNNTIYDTRTISGIPNVGGINIEDDGDPLYLEYNESMKRNFYPIFGIRLLDSISSTIIYSPRSENIISAETTIVVPVNETAGNVTVGHTLYSYWNDEHGIRLGMNKIIGLFGFESEFLTRRAIFSNFSFYIETPITHISGVYFFRIHLEGNLSRTPETINIRNSGKFVPGGKIDFGLYLWNNNPDWPQVFGRFHCLYNHYETMRIFRHSVERWGFGFSVGLHFGHIDMSAEEDDRIQDNTSEGEL